jgi:hypothetical protein
MAARLGEQARAAIVGRLDWPSLAERIEGVYHRMLAGAPVTSPLPQSKDKRSRPVKAAERSSP